jgi:integrase
MPKRSDVEFPTYCHHKASGQAVVRLDGNDIYLGKHGSAESRAKFNALIAEWLANGRRLPVDPTQTTIAEIAAAFRKHARNYYRHPDGTATSEVTAFDIALKPLLKLYGKSVAAEFGPLRLKTVRDEMIHLGWCRASINKHVGRIKHLFKWAAENELVKPDVYHGLLAVSGLRMGRSDAEESRPVKPVSLEVVNATLPHVSAEVQTMIRLQLITGMRSGEVVSMRTGDIDRSGKLWVYRPSHHKNLHRGHAREVYLGPKAQELLTPYLKLDPQRYLFNPKEAEQQRLEKRHGERKTPLDQGNRPGTNQKRRRGRSPKDHYSVASFRRAIERGCEFAFGMPDEIREPRGKAKKSELELPGDEQAKRRADRAKARGAWHEQHCWFPHQLRHTAATELRKTHGLEAAQVLLGHRTLTVTQLYAEKNLEAAMKIASQVG